MGVVGEKCIMDVPSPNFDCLCGNKNCHVCWMIMVTEMCAGIVHSSNVVAETICDIVKITTVLLCKCRGLGREGEIQECLS